MSEKLEKWLSDLNISVVYHNDENAGNSYNLNDNEIMIYNHSNSRLFSLLHEAGHAVLRFDLKTHKSLYPATYHDDPELRDWVDDLLQEEYDAWQQGYLISDMLNLDIDTDNYEKHADNCLNSYRKFAVTISEFEQGIISEENDAFKMVLDYFERLS